VLVDPTERPGLPGALLAKLHDACEQAVTRWQQFKTSEPLLFNVLELACRRVTTRN